MHLSKVRIENFRCFGDGPAAFELSLQPGLTALVEYLTYGTAGGDPILHVTWSAKDTGEERHGRPYRRVEVRSGKNGDGPVFVQEVRDLLRATYLRPLRDAEGALSAGRGSRLSEILYHNAEIKAGGKFDEAQGVDNLDGTALKDFSVLGIGDLANALLQQQKGVVDTKKKIDDHLDKLTLAG